VSTRLIVDHWEEMQRLASSIRHGVTPASVLMRKLASYPRQNQLAQALAEVGKIEQTIHLLESYRSEAMRRRIERRLDRHESTNALGRALFVGRQGVMRDRAFQDQMHRASCLVMVMAAIIAWNTVYLQDAVSALRAAGEVIPDELLKHMAPLGWRHINLLGRYEFQGPAYVLDRRRPLRTEAASALDGVVEDEPDVELGAW
jgi:TnpA family transposase